MKISQDICVSAEDLSDVDAGLGEMAEKFRQGGGEIYVPSS